MANHSLPTQTSGYLAFVQQMDYRFDDLARGLDPSKSPTEDPTILNLPVDSIGWSSEGKKWRKWNGSTWESLVANDLYSINISGNAATVTNGVYNTGDQTISGVKTFLSTIVGSINGNAATVTNGVYTTGNQTITGVKTFSSLITGSIDGNAATATAAVNLSTTRSDWATKGTISAVVGQLSWKNFGNGHTIFDASAGTSPSGTTIDNSNPTNSWTANSPTLMGWNGTQTYGVRVDVAKYAESFNIGYDNNSNESFQILWGSGNSIYGTAGIYCNPSTDYLYSTSFVSSSWFRSTGDTGWISETYGVGIYATDSSNVRTYNGANFVSGSNLIANGDVTAYSDETLKTNWRELPKDFVSELAKIRCGIYDRIDCDRTQVGVSAQSLQSLLPNAVSKNSDGLLSVAYGNAALVSSIKLAEKIVEQENQLNIQNERIAQLEKLISKLMGA